MTFRKWKLGDVTVTRVVESASALPLTGMFPEADPSTIAGYDWLRPHFLDGDGNMMLSIHAFVIESRGRRIVVDTCVGEGKTLPYPDLAARQVTFLDDLERAGFAPGSIDTVMCTHLHFDHVGWNTRLVSDRWVPTFPNARYLMGRIEFEHWATAEANAYAGGAVLEESVYPIVEAGLQELVEMDHNITDEVWLEPSVGHSPGHVSVRIASDGHEAVITGDMMHHPVQVTHPEWLVAPDGDPARATVTRREFCDRYGDRDVLVLGTHFHEPTSGRISKHGSQHRFDASEA